MPPKGGSGAGGGEKKMKDSDAGGAHRDGCREIERGYRGGEGVQGDGVQGEGVVGEKLLQKRGRSGEAAGERSGETETLGGQSPLGKSSARTQASVKMLTLGVTPQTCQSAPVRRYGWIWRSNTRAHVHAHTTHQHS